MCCLNEKDTRHCKNGHTILAKKKRWGAFASPQVVGVELQDLKKKKSENPIRTFRLVRKEITGIE